MHSIFAIIVVFTLSFSVNAEPTSAESDPLWIDETMDDVITPFKKWLDKDPEAHHTQQQLQQASSLRAAIKQALRQHKGTVLSADDAGAHYDIKILSKGGTVKVIRIANRLSSQADSVNNPESSQPNSQPNTQINGASK